MKPIFFLDIMTASSQEGPPPGTLHHFTKIKLNLITITDGRNPLKTC